jgi:hypothetical protein
MIPHAPLGRLRMFRPMLNVNHTPGSTRESSTSKLCDLVDRDQWSRLASGQKEYANGSAPLDHNRV